MKPFNLTDWLAGKPAVTRGGDSDLHWHNALAKESFEIADGMLKEGGK